MLPRTRSIFHLEGEEGEEGEGETVLNNGGFLAINAGDSLVGLQILIQQKYEQGFNVPADSSGMICKKPAIISVEFLKSCFWCSKELSFHKEVYMYRFFSVSNLKLPGRAYVTEIMNGHEGRAFNYFRMSAGIFRQLVSLLEERSLVGATRNMPVFEQVAIFLRIVAHGDSYRTAGEFFQHSLETISRNFHKVLKAIVQLSSEFIQLPTNGTRCCGHIRKNRHFYPFFKDAIGAIDGTHIPAFIPEHKQNRYRNRKDFVSQNVMAAVDFNRQFVYVVTGWEGSAADMRILRWAVEQGNLNIPRGKFYLVDSGYANTEKFIAPIRGFRYHLSNYRTQEQRNYSGPEELFNHRHAQLRNVVERTFGILKQRFKVLTAMKTFDFSSQANVVQACCILHNFISRYCNDDVLMNMDEAMLLTPEDDDDDNQAPNQDWSLIGGQAEGEVLRTIIKNDLWLAQARRGTLGRE